MKKVVIRKATVAKFIKAELVDAVEGKEADFKLGNRYVEIMATGERGEKILEGINKFCNAKEIGFNVKHWGYGGMGVYLNEAAPKDYDYCDVANPIHY